MSKYAIEDSTLTAIADAMRQADGTTEKITPEEMPAKAAALFEAGAKSEYDKFWDVYQEFGERRDYRVAFAVGWDDTIFRPKYDMRPTRTSQMFQYTRIVDLVGILERQGVVLDTSASITGLQMFQSCNTTRIPEIDARKMTNTSYMFGGGAKVQTIDKLIVSSTTELSSATFSDATDLTNIIFEGTIARTIDLHWSPLSKASILSTIGCLSDTTSDLTASFSLAAVNTAFESSRGAADGSTSAEWLALIDTKPNWTISLA